MEVTPPPQPTPAGALMVGGAVHTSTSVRGDTPPRLHPLLSRVLGDLPPEARERYTGWCAELVLVSDRLWAAEESSDGPLDAGAARTALRGARIQVVRVREEGDPAHGAPQRPCRACSAVLGWLDVGAVAP